MKQIKVYITAEQWAEKRLQLVCYFENIHEIKLEVLDKAIYACGFELIESETKPEQPQPSEIPTDKVEAVKYFLNQLPEGYKERALAQVDEKRVNAYPLVTDITLALIAFNSWDKTKELPAFWDDVSDYFENPSKNTGLPPLPND